MSGVEAIKGDAKAPQKRQNDLAGHKKEKSLAEKNRI